jgi:hypothetical protein
MKKTTMLFYLLLIIVVAGFIWSYTQRHSEVSQTDIEQVAVEGVAPAAKDQSFSGVGTLADLRTQNKDLECQILLDRENDTPIEGTYFTSKGNLRGDFIVPVEGGEGTMLSSMIVGGDAMYIWSTIEGQKFGVKTSLQAKQAVDTKEPVPIDATVKYTCSDWEMVDGSVFIPPADVSFKDAAALIEAGMEDGTLLP